MLSEAPPTSGSTVDCAVYVDGQRLPGTWTHAGAITEVRTRGDGFVWIGLYEPDADEVRELAKTFGLHELAVAAAVRTYQRPALTRYGDLLLMVFKTVRHVAHESPLTANEIVETGEIIAFLGTDFIVTVRRGEHSGLRGLRADLEAAPARLRAGAAAVLHAIADRMVNTYQAVTTPSKPTSRMWDRWCSTPAAPSGPSTCT